MLPELSAAGMLVARKALIPIDNILGAWVIGLIISSAIWGVTGLQIYHYFTKFSTRDGPFLKSFVCTLFVVDTLHLCLISEAFYVAAITNFGDYLSLGEVTWSQIAQIPVGVIMGTMVQLFYAYRIWLLGNRSPWIPAAIVVSSLGEFAIAIVYTHKAVQVKFYVDAAADLPYATTSLALELACDIFIAFGMVFNLLRNKTAYTKTNRAIHLLVAYTINSGMLNMFVAMGCLISWVTSTQTLIYTPFFFVLVHLYGCSFMSILNSRDYVRNQMHDTVTVPSTGHAHAMVSIQYSSNHYTGTETTVGNRNPGAGVGSKGAASNIHAHGQTGPGSQLEAGIAFYPPARKDEY